MISFIGISNFAFNDRQLEYEGHYSILGISVDNSERVLIYFYNAKETDQVS